MYEIINDTASDIIEIDELDKYLQFVVDKEKLNEALFNVIFVTNERIHEINLEYRNVDRVTDVISFALEDNDSKFDKLPIRVLGDIYIAKDVAYAQALEYGHSRLREVCFLATHGLLHLLGYDHMEKEEEEVMFKKQEALLNAYQIKR